uniref:M20_dimer domain-containing protein n=1 Tax=Panagrellus redivivus TaxID=6233 RepID=A0A7E4WD00_PANRE
MIANSGSTDFGLVVEGLCNGNDTYQCQSAFRLRITAMEALVAAKHDIAAFLEAMMSIDSTTGKEGALGFAVKEFLKAEGFNIILQPIPAHPHRFNLIATWGQFTAPGPRILFNTHLDTVPPFLPPVRKEHEIWGRGSNDAKGQIASQIFALRRLIGEVPHLAGQVGLLLVVGEETDHIGMKEANKFSLQPEYLIVGEPTDMKFATLQKGALKFKLTVKGTAAHSGYPHLGHSAIETLLDILESLRHYSWPKSGENGDTTLNIGLINGGQALNALAAEASAQIFIRVTESSKDLLAVVEKLVNGRADIEILGINEPVRLTRPPIPYPSEPVAFNTDIPYFDYRNHCKGLFLFGPGSIQNAHSLKEFMPIDQLEESVDVLVDLVKALFAKRGV